MATLERLRSSLEDIEEVDRLIVKELDSDTAKTQREQITSDHKIASYLRAAEARARTCLDIYKDEDGVKKAELELMTGPNALTNFYDQLRESKAYHRRFQTATTTQEGRQLVAPLGQQLDAAADAEGQFSGEENVGRYVDLNSFYQRFVNLPGRNKKKEHSNKLDYRSYLDIFADFRPGAQGIPTGQKRAAYHNYVGDLHDYLRGFYERCHPLADMAELDARVSEEFTESLSSDGLKQKEGFVDLSEYSSPKELEALGLDKLKAALQALALKCGGNLQQRAERLFRAKGQTPEQLLASPDSVHNTGALGKKKKKRRKRKHSTDNVQSEGGGNGNSNDHDEEAAKLRRGVAEREFAIGFFARLLANTVKNTKQYVETRQIRTYEELAAEKAAQEEAEALQVAAGNADGDSDDEEAPTYNPLNLPLGWDGKPIPFWLYKLHGLGEEFKCEICGNESYWGRRAFDRHFQESRHAYGMRCLGIPNTKHFHDITLIEDARALYAKMTKEVSRDTWKADMDEEFEDSEGNVFDKKTYEDLAKQGLL